MLTSHEAAGDCYRCYFCCPKRPGRPHVQIWSRRPLPLSVNSMRNSIKTSVCSTAPRPVPKVPQCVYALAHYMRKLHQKAFVYTLFIHFQRVKQPIYWAVNNPEAQS